MNKRTNEQKWDIVLWGAETEVTPVGAVDQSGTWPGDPAGDVDADHEPLVVANGVADPVDEGHRVFSRLGLLELVDVSHELEN